MNLLNPELESLTDTLAKLCCDMLNSDETAFDESARPTIEALVINGYARLSDVNLQMRVEQKAVDKCLETVIHRRGELSNFVARMQSIFDEQVIWKTQTPNNMNRSKPGIANTSTDI